MEVNRAEIPAAYINQLFPVHTISAWAGGGHYSLTNRSAEREVHWERKEISPMKAVLLAGGTETNLRPLTCDIPKPMIRLCGRPVIQYMVELLERHGCREMAVSVYYLPEKVREWTRMCPRSIPLEICEAEKPMGTAGSVRQAIRGWYPRLGEELVVADSQVLTDVDIGAALTFHRETGAAVTLVICRVNNSRDYTPVDTDEEGRVTGFSETAVWNREGREIGDTGIYILSPEVFPYIPDSTASDFLRDVFPQLLKDGLPIFAYEDTGYWNGLRSFPEILSAQRDLLEGRVRTALSPDNGIVMAGGRPAGNYAIHPPVYIGRDVKIGTGAQIGPFAVIDDGCHIGHNAKIRGSVLMPSAYMGDRAAMTGTLLCHGASVGRGASLFEGVVIGEGGAVGEYASVNPDVRVWPGKQIEANACQRENLRYGRVQPALFDETGIVGETGAELTPELCARLGAAIGSLERGAKVAVGCSRDKAAEALKLALISGILSSGGRVWDFGPGIEPQFDYFVNFSMIHTGVYIAGGPRGCVRLSANGGLPALRVTEREVERRLADGDFIRTGWDSIQEAADMSGMRQLYRQELISMAPDGLGGMCAEVRGSDREPVKLLHSVLSTIGCSMEGGLRLHLGTGGRRLSVFDPIAGYIWPERVLAINCLMEVKQGHDLALPYDAPAALEQMAKAYGVKIKRYYTCPIGRSDGEARRLAASQPWVRDGLMMAVRLLSWMKRYQITISDLLEELPVFAVNEKAMACPIEPAEVLRKLSEEPGSQCPGELWEGTRMVRNQGVVSVRPSKLGKSLILTAEAADTETAAELCGELEQKLGSVLLDIGEEKQ